MEQYGFRAVIAPSFADIFFNNCFKNGLLPIRLDESDVEQLFQFVEANIGARLIVNLENQTVSTKDGALSLHFDVDAFRKYCLLNGLDDIGLTLVHAEKIREFEKKHIQAQPWLAKTI